jgi:hypothetical protein
MNKFIYIKYNFTLHAFNIKTKSLVNKKKKKRKLNNFFFSLNMYKVFPTYIALNNFFLLNNDR